MKIKWSHLCAIALVGGLLMACDQAGSVGIAYVDVQEVLRDSKVGKRLTDQVKSHTDKVSKKLRAKQNRLEREQKTISQQRSTLSASALQSKESVFRQKVARFQENYRAENERLNTGRQASLAEIQTVLEQIYKELQDKNGIDVLLNRGVLLADNDDLDITDQVIKVLDERLPDVKLEVPKE